MEDVAGMHANAQFAGDLAGLHAALADAPGGGLHFESGHERVAMLVGVRFRAAEDGEQTVAGKFVNRSLIVEYDLSERGQIVVQKFHDFVGVAVGSRQGEAAHVGEENRDFRTLAAGTQKSFAGFADDAMAEFQKAAAIDPRSDEAQNNIGRVLAAKGRIQDAIPYFEKAVEINPGLVEAQYYLGAALYYARGQAQEALVHLRDALRVAPDYLPALNEAAHLLAGCSDASARNGPEAVKFGERAVALTSGRDAKSLDTLAAAYAEAGRFADAIETARRGLEIATRQNESQLREGLAARMRLYEAKTPYRDSAPR